MGEKPRSRLLPWGRVRVPLVWACLAALIANAALDAVPFWTTAAAFVAAMALYLRLGAPERRAAVAIEPPVRGRWRAINSPSDRVPSHGLHAYGQTFAADFVREPRDGGRPRFGWWPLAVPPRRFPGFGAPVLAPGPGTVVKARSRARDHWSRNSWPALALMVVEGTRELLGPGAILGNHVVIDLGEGVYAVAAHLQRGSVPVRPGDRVVAGQRIGRCGNSGNSSEPHLHFQLMDHPNVALADGVPFAFAYGDERHGERGEDREEERRRVGVPAGADPFVA